MIIREIDYDKLLQNIEEMINTLEYDSSRSGGKTKLNCDKLTITNVKISIILITDFL